MNGTCDSGNLTVHGEWGGIVIEDNRIFHDVLSSQMGIEVPIENNPGPGDAVNGNAVVRDNVVCFSSPLQNSTAFFIPAATTATGNVYRSGADASTGACAR